jgi:hypothetical protein
MPLKSGFRGYLAAWSAIIAFSILFPNVGRASDLVFGPVTCQRAAGAPPQWVMATITIAGEKDVTDGEAGYVGELIHADMIAIKFCLMCGVRLVQ